YQSWQDGKRWELIDGCVHAMSPSPTCRHQDISLALGSQMLAFFKGKKCRVFPAPMDVKLSEEDVVQPDLLVVCNPGQIKQHVEGPPSLVVEILSESSLSHDRILKTDLYARFGVKEYWIVTPFPSVVEVYLLQDGKYLRWKAFGGKDALTSPSFPDLEIELKDVFDFPLEPHELALLVVKEPPAHYRPAAP
ncbi:MAG: Uma2 family endonuclease, partial [Lentisphaerota bacterium]